MSTLLNPTDVRLEERPQTEIRTAPAADPGMDAPLEHSEFGGSSAARVLRCPGSVKLVRTVPAHLRRTSSYATRGSALHSAMPLLIEEKRSIDDLVGETINDYTVTDDDIELALRPVLTYVVALLDTPGAEFFLERRVIFQAIANTFGTCDLIVRIGRSIHVIDFKFGAGVRVRALTPDGDDDVINAQLMFYAAAARYSLPEFFAGVENIVLTIVQPQSIEVDAESVSSVAVAHAEVNEFIATYRAACEDALSEAPHLERGPHCRFCAARPICPEHTKPLLDFAQFVVPTPPATLADKAAYLQALAAGLELVDAIKDLRTTLHDQAKAALAAGDQVPGFTLSEGRAVRSWQDEAAAAPALLRLGLMRDDVIEETLRSPAQVEKRAKARGVKVPKELISSKPSGVSLVKVENARAPVPGRGELARSFSAALEAFQGGRQA
jgi:hypothetical protein